MGSLALHRCLFVLAMLVIGGCAQQQFPGAQGSQAGKTATVEFAACRVGVSFSGIPEQVPKEETQKLIDSLGKYAKVDADARRFDQYRLSEVAVCICRDMPFTDQDFEIGTFLVKSVYEIDGVGWATVIEQERSPAERMHTLAVRLGQVQNCGMWMYVHAPPTNDAAKDRFFGTLRATQVATPTSPAGMNAAARLLQLDKLLKDRLITQDEYNTRRKRIVDSL